MRHRKWIRRQTSILASFVILVGALVAAPAALGASSGSSAEVSLAAAPAPARTDDRGVVTGVVTLGEEIAYVTTIDITVQSTNLSRLHVKATHGDSPLTEAWVASGSGETCHRQHRADSNPPTSYECSIANAIAGKGDHTFTVVTAFRPTEVGAESFNLIFSYLEGQGAGTPKPKTATAGGITHVEPATEQNGVKAWLPPEGGTVETSQTIDLGNRQSTHVTVPNLTSSAGDVTALTTVAGSAPPSGYMVTLGEVLAADGNDHCGPAQQDDPNDPNDGTDGTEQCTSEISEVAVECAVASECTPNENADNEGAFVFPDGNPLHVRIKSLAPSGLLPPTIWHHGREVLVGSSTASCPDSYLYNDRDRGNLGDPPDTVDACSYRNQQTLGFDGLAPYVQFEVWGRKNGDYRS